MEIITSKECLTPGEVRNKKQSGENIQVIDVRSQEEYAQRHIPGAVNLPLAELSTTVSSLGKDTLIVTACGKGGGRSADGAKVLQNLGYRAFWLCGGTFGWLDEN